MTDATGTVVSQTRYKAWGEVRHQSGVTPTEYGFTGQFSHAADFGLMFYNARWYDVSLGRFAQADSIIPPGVQGLDRYAYVNNSPMNYVDPSGHDPWWCEGDDLCMFNWMEDHTSGGGDGYFAEYGVKVDAEFNKTQRRAIMAGIFAVGGKFAESRGNGESAASAFRAVFDEGVSFELDEKCDGCRAGKIKGTNKLCGSDYTSPGCVPGGAFTSGTTITFASFNGENVNNFFKMTLNVVHELGHVYYGEVGNPTIGSAFSRDALIPNSCDGCYEWQQHPPSMNATGEDILTELFGDTFVAWTYGAWNPLNMNAADAANGAMNNLVPKP